MEIVALKRKGVVCISLTAVFLASPANTGVQKCTKRTELRFRAVLIKDETDLRFERVTVG